MSENWYSISSAANAYANGNEARQYASAAVTDYIKSNYGAYGINSGDLEMSYTNGYFDALNTAWSDIAG